jgi:hypothetical protein
VVLLPVIDQRSVKYRIGMIKDVVGNDRRDLISDHDPGDWLHARVEAALRTAGYNVISDPDGPVAPTLQIHLIKFFSESVLSNQMTTVDFETDIAFQAVVTRPDGLEAERRYYEKGGRELYIVTLLSKLAGVRQRMPRFSWVLGRVPHHAEIRPPCSAVQLTSPRPPAEAGALQPVVSQAADAATPTDPDG